MRIGASALLAGLLGWGQAAAQTTPGPPGPWVADIRGATSGIPPMAGFYPSLPAATSVPARGFGFDGGVHVYPFTLGASRVGLGAAVLVARGTSEAAVALVRSAAPQVSFNFGTADGWSYLSAGVGVASIVTEAPSIDGGRTANRSGSVRAVNAGGGARWFLTPHVAFGFDVRMHRLSGGKAGEATIATPGATLVAASVGFSVR
jgi:hypothetical protein